MVARRQWSGVSGRKMPAKVNPHCFHDCGRVICLPKKWKWLESQGPKWFYKEGFVCSVDRVNTRGIRSALVVSDVNEKESIKEMKNRKQERDCRISRKLQGQ